MKPSPTLNLRRAVAAVVGLALVAVLAACELDAEQRSIVADRDTFSVSNHPDANRGRDTVMRIMDSQGKLKIGYVSFAVGGSSATIDATLRIVPQHNKFTVDVRNVGAFTEATSHLSRPALGSKVGTLPETKAGQRQSIALTGVQVVDGRVNLALTTSSPYELEVMSREGASNGDDQAPTLVVGTSGRTPDTTAPPTTAAPTTTAPPATTAPSGPAGWRLTFADEFNGSRVDATKWNVYDEGTSWGSVESPKASTCPKASNVSVTGGKLVMRMAKANGSCAGGQAQTGAGMNTWGKFEQSQGRWEARVRWTHKGNNLWGGFWTHGNGGAGYDKSKASEIDIFEYIGKTNTTNMNRFKPAIHYDYSCPVPCGMQNLVHSPIDVTQWHTYTLEWDEARPGDPSSTQLRWYLDGRQIAQFDKQGVWRVNADGSKTLTTSGHWINKNAPFPYPFDSARDHRIILSAWVGAPGSSATDIAAGFNPSGGSAAFEVDYVRVYERG